MPKHLKYFTELACAKLEHEYKKHPEKFLEKDNKWVLELFKDNPEKYIKTTEIEIDEFKPYMIQTENGKKLSDKQLAEEDLINAKNFYKAYKNLTPREATFKGIWWYICFIELYEYIQHRWINQDRRPTTIENRFFGKTAEKLRMENAASRLWWPVKLSYDETHEDSFHLTNVLLTGSTVATDVLDTPNRYNPQKRMKALLLALKEFFPTLNPNETKSGYVRDCMFYLNHGGAVKCYDYLEVEEFKEIVLECLRKARAIKLNGKIDSNEERNRLIYQGTIFD